MYKIIYLMKKEKLIKCILNFEEYLRLNVNMLTSDKYFAFYIKCLDLVFNEFINDVHF